MNKISFYKTLKAFEEIIFNKLVENEIEEISECV
jgi:hypothetical protein